MGLSPGTRLGPYQIVAPIGAGGMGEVYRARDTRLDRDVAIKALPDAFSSDPERLTRFEREAKLLASVSDPNLASIYGIEEVDGRRYLVLEYVEGETLAARLARGALPPEEAMAVCLQIATGMEAAHEVGIVHRDLKPGNVMIAPGDQVKVLDFGLAKGKVVEWEEVSPESPTVTEMASPTALPGVSVGTARYLSPEQARGKAVDRRTDIWSFGCVLYECLTGRKAFEGETVSDVIAGILGGEVAWDRLPKTTPARVRELLERCLERDPRKRLRDMGDARLALEEVKERRGAVGPPSPRPRFLSFRVIGFAALIVVAGLVAIKFWPRPQPTSKPLKRFEIQWPRGMYAGESGAPRVWVSPNGQSVYAAGLVPAKGQNEAALYRRPIEGGKFERVTGSDGGWEYHYTSDGRWLYFLRVAILGEARVRTLMRMPADREAPPVKVAVWDSSWGTNFVPLSSGDVLAAKRRELAYVRLPAGGGAPSEPIPFDIPGVSGGVRFREALPGDRGVLVQVPGRSGVIDPVTGKGEILIEGGVCASYAPTGHLLFSRGSTLMAVRFDLDRLEVQGQAVTVLEGLRSRYGWNGQFEMSALGIVTYVPGGIVGNRRWFEVVDGDGNVTEWNPERRPIGPGGGQICVDPSGERAAFEAPSSDGIEIRVSERGAAPSQRVIAMAGLDCQSPDWSPDGKRIAFIATDGGGAHTKGFQPGVYVQSVEGGAPRRVCEPMPFFSWFPDGRALLGTQITRPREAARLVRIEIPSEGDSLSVPVPLEIVPAPAIALDGQFSPDGHWIAYWSTRDGIYIVPYRLDGSLGMARRLTSEGIYPRWSRTGKRIFYGSIRPLPSGEPRATIKSISLKFAPSFSASKPEVRWDPKQLGMARGAGLPDYHLPGDRMLFVRGEGEEPPKVVEVVLGIFGEIERKFRAADGEPKRFQIRYPSSLKQVLDFDISPDGRALLVVAIPQKGDPGLYRRPIQSGDFQRIPGSDYATHTPRFTSDGRWAYFLVGASEAGGTRLMRIPTGRDAPPVKVADWDSSWANNFVPLNSGDVLAARPSALAYVRLPAGGGAPSEPIRIDIPGASAMEIYLAGTLPGDRGVVVHWRGGFGVIDVETGQGKILGQYGGWPTYMPTGHLLFMRGSSLMAVPFDLDRLECRGEPVAILHDVGLWSVSEQGILVHMPPTIGTGNRRRLEVVVNLLDEIRRKAQAGEGG